MYSESIRGGASSVTRVRDLLSRLSRDLQDGTVPQVRVADLARAAGVSVRTVYRASARHLNAPPIARVRRSRLEGARRSLLAAGPADTVTSTAMEWGFTHLGRFAGHYRKAFGESPSETLRRGRAVRKGEPAARAPRAALRQSMPDALRA